MNPTTPANRKRRVFSNIIDAIGGTPIVKLNKIIAPNGAHLYAKLEFLNPGGSIKDRIGLALIEDAEKRGALLPGGTIVEGTSGNTGVGLALVANQRGYKCVFVMPDKMSKEKIQNLRSFGAEVVITPTNVEADDPKSYYQVSRRLAREIPGAVYLDQYNNLANRTCHFQTTGPEILEQFPEIDYFVAGMGTGGTITGCAQYFKQHKPSTKIIGIDPKGSILIDAFTTGTFDPKTAKTYKIEGIGEDFIPANYDFSVIDEMVRVEDQESFEMTRRLLTDEGFFAGISSGSAVVGALRYCASHPDSTRGKNILIILPDSGNRYTSKAFNDEWMESTFGKESIK